MLARTRLIALLLFLAAAGHIVYHTWHITDADRSFFAKLSMQSEENPQPLTSQEKKGITKDAYYTNNGKRQHTHIAADTSVLKAIPIGKTYELIETMHGISGTMVDGDQKRIFASKEGTYFYNTHEFITKMASVQLFKLTLRTEVDLDVKAKVQRYKEADEPNSLEFGKEGDAVDWRLLAPQMNSDMCVRSVFKDKLLVDGLARQVKLRFSSDGAKFEASQIKAHIPDTKELK